MCTKVHPNFSVLQKQVYAYQPKGRVENPLSDMEQFQRPHVIRDVIESVNRNMYNSLGNDSFEIVDRNKSVSTIVMNENDYVTIEFDKSEYWFVIKRTFRNENGRKVHRRRKMNWIIAHSVACDECMREQCRVLGRVVPEHELTTHVYTVVTDCLGILDVEATHKQQAKKYVMEMFRKNYNKRHNCDYKILEITK